MPVLIAVVTLCCVACVFNTAVLVAVVRRLQTQSELLSETEARGVPAKALPVGATVGDFLTYDTEGRAITAAVPADTLIGFFSPTCGSCRRERRRFRLAAARWPGGRSRVVAVVTGPDASARFLSRLTAVARIVVDQDETVRHAFDVQGFPAAFVVTESGRLAWTGLHVDVVPGLAEEPVPASLRRSGADSPKAV